MSQYFDDDFIALIQIVEFCISLKNEQLNQQSISNDEIARKLEEESQRLIQDNHEIGEKIIKQNEQIIEQNNEIIRLLKGDKKP